MRIHLGGHEGPIPDLALPDAYIDTSAPPQVLFLEDGVPFNPADIMAFGYTHYEVWCVGGAGGRGSDGGGRYQGYYNQFDPQGNSGPTSLQLGLGTYRVPDPAHPGATLDRVWDVYVNVNYQQQLCGGGGGGGGLHVVSGKLEDLPSSVPVTVGKAGADGPPAQVAKPGDYTTSMADLMYYQGAVYDPPYVVIPAPRAGEDGGASSFGDICKASGGKGGKPAGFWINNELYYDGTGGDGGTGGSTVAGGGGAGASTVSTAKDGTWDGTIGQGGGGGRGGTYSDPPVQFPSGPAVSI